MLTAFLIALAVMCGITLFLTLTILVCESRLADYGEIPLTVNGEREVVVEGGRPLLAALKDRQIFIPSACGGRGSCGLCKLRIREGAGDLLPTEAPWLSAKERQEQVRLACQVKVRRPMRLDIPRELFSVRQYTTRVEALRDLTYDIKEVTLRLPEGQSMDFKAGQYIQFEVPPYALTDEPVYRAYSLASDPALGDRLELEIRLVPNGICTTYVHKILKAGDAVTVNGPYGDFYLRDTDRPIVFVAGGSGMAPIKAILHAMAKQGSTREARYFFGARTERDLFLTDLMADFQRRLPRFEFIPALSAAEPGSGWAGERGLITEVLGRRTDSLQEAEAYLCGSPGMIDACIAVLKAKGMPAERIYYDKFA